MKFDKKIKNILITGGAGFIGSNLARILTQEYNFKVTIFDDFFTGSEENIRGLSAEVIKASVLDETALKKHVNNKDIVFHLAARNIIASIKNPLDDMNTNIRGTYNVLTECKIANVKKTVYASTSSIYGNSKQIPINEDETPNFLNFYSVSKYAGEGYTKIFYEQYDLPVCIVRYSNVYGTNQSASNPYCGVVGKFINLALQNKPLEIHGDGEQTRDYTFVDDACRATIHAALDPKSIGDVFNIGTGTETSVNLLSSTIIKLSNSNSKIVHIDKREIDNIRRRVLNIEKIRYKLKFFPVYTLNEGIQKTINWYSNHRHKK
ncbi:MAG: NAD-dependent epimerase/dehydratase family protein [Bacteroidales bacterium]